MKVGGIRYGRSYGAESVENAEFARSKRGSSEMNGTKSNLSCALGVSGVAARDVTCESEEDEEEGVEWGTRMYGVRMSPEIRTLLRSQPEDMTRWLTTSQMGRALTREENEVINEKRRTRG